ncbi:hypothetical protein OEB99_14440 [Actinotalea sp. M2MS4P-6]|uniref:hypothetical protein n=1 Tax=Actinotalea sp. M2MS4P-6 TaxID=2983762 RepID=UPI0021E477E5|nr:hypothetical protein [Actinotalea sp. M2MS4P-6]MCV2395512.1 hypothetical protein [Actinotalea sp. M2MS4P-6]
MTVQGATGEAAASDDRRARSSRFSRPRHPAWWIALGVAVVLLVTWAVVATRPALVDAGAAYTDPVFVQTDDGWASGTEVWSTWDTPDGGWVSVALQNTRSWAVTVSVPPRALADLDVQVANDEDWLHLVDLRPESLDLRDSVRVPPHGIVVAAVHVSGRCFAMAGGSARFADAVTLEVTGLGLTRNQTLALPAQYEAGYTTDHTPPADCPTP